jgi:hypothetical protein
MPTAAATPAAVLAATQAPMAAGTPLPVSAATLVTIPMEVVTQAAALEASAAAAATQMLTARLPRTAMVIL